MIGSIEVSLIQALMVHAKMMMLMMWMAVMLMLTLMDADAVKHVARDGCVNLNMKVSPNACRKSSRNEVIPELHLNQ